MLVVAPTVGYDSFVSLADADAYFAERGYTAWPAATETDRNNALRVATVYVSAQRLLPSVINPEVHPRVQTATMEAAKLALSGELYKTGSSAAVIEKTVGPLTLKYAAPSQVFNRFPYIDDLLLGLTYNAGGPIFFERV